jgi:hypothetical protein
MVCLRVLSRSVMYRFKSVVLCFGQIANTVRLGTRHLFLFGFVYAKNYFFSLSFLVVACCCIYNLMYIVL